MSANSSITSFTDLDGNVKKITTYTIEKVTDATDYRIIQTFLPTKKYKSSDTLAVIEAEASSLFAATENGVDILINSLLVKEIVALGSACQIIYQGGAKITVEESVSTIEARMDADSNTDVALEDPTPPTTLSNSSYYNLTTSGTFTIEDAATTYNANPIFQMRIRNSSGSDCIFNRSATNTFEFLGEDLTTFTLQDGEEILLTAVSTTEYNIG